MLDRLETKGIVLSAYNRYVDDITAISDVREKNEKGKLFLILEDELNKLDPIGNSIRVTGEQIYADRSNNQPEKEQGLAYLDLWQKLFRGTLGQIRIKCGIYRKKAAADMYILPSKQGILKGEFLRFVTLCSTEKEYDKACDRYDKALQTRGYSAHDVHNVRKNVKWENKKHILIKREEKKKKGKGDAPGIAVVPERLFRCVRTTELLAHFVKKRGKR